MQEGISKVMKKILILFWLYPPCVFAVTCPVGFVAYEYDSFVPATGGVCASGYVGHSLDAVCASGGAMACWLVRVLCDAGVTELKTSDGLSFPLYSEKNTSPSIHIKYNDTVCYVDLEEGVANAAINVSYNGVVYHTVK